MPDDATEAAEVPGEPVAGDAEGGGDDDGGADAEDPGHDEDAAGPDDAPEKDGGLPMSLEEILNGNLLEMAKDKLKSRQLQRSLLRGSPEVSKLIFSKAEPIFMELVRDQYGNYLSQKILEVASAEQFDALFTMLRDHLKDLALDVHGTRAVQKVVEQAISRDKVPELLEAVPAPLIDDLARSVTGFHVIVKMVESLPMQEADDLLDQLCGTPEKALALGQDQWGCCVLKKCVDRADGAARHRIIEAVADNTLSLVQDPFGNYVVQHLVLMGGRNRPNPVVTRIIDALRGRMFELSLQKFSSNALEKCLLNSSDKDRNKIINEILNPPNHLPSEAVRMLLFHQFGNYVFQQALEVAKDPQFSLLVEHSKQLIQDVVRSAQQHVETAQPPGNLASEHTRRLAMKLVKKYPALSEGLELDAGAASVANGWGQYYDPYMSAYGSYDAYGNWAAGPIPAATVYGYPYPAWDPSFGTYQPLAYPPTKGPGSKGSKGTGGGSASRARSQGRRAGQKADGGKGRGGQPRSKASAGAPKGGGGSPGGGCGGGDGGDTVRVGRIVGFWPNYTITYDEVVAAGGGGGGGRARSKNKAKGKAAPKKGAAPVAA